MRLKQVELNLDLE